MQQIEMIPKTDLQLIKIDYDLKKIQTQVFLGALGVICAISFGWIGLFAVIAFDLLLAFGLTLVSISRVSNVLQETMSFTGEAPC